MKWMNAVINMFTPSDADRAEVAAMQAKTLLIQEERRQAYITLDAAHQQAEALQAMDRRNHYSESMTQAMRGNRR